MALGDKIKEARKNKGLTQKELAALINAKHNSISNWENNQNKPDPDTIELICGALDVSPAYLLGWEQPERLASYFGRITNKVSEINEKQIENLLDLFMDMTSVQKDLLINIAKEMTTKKE